MPRPVASEASGSVGARVAELLRSFFAEVPGDQEGKAPTSFDAAVQMVSSSLDRWRSSSGVIRFTQAARRDRLVGVGVSVEVVAPLGGLTRLRATTARIRLGEQVVDEVPIEGPQVRAVATSGEPGIYQVIVDALDRRGRVVGWGRGQVAPIVQVVGATPTAAVDAALLLGEAPRDLAALRELSLRGWALAFFDLHPEDRQEAIRAALAQHRLPRSAILVHPRSDVEFKTLGIDFHELFAATRVRRIRADGVPLVLIISDESEVWGSACAAEGIASADLAELGERLRRSDGLDAWTASAEAFARAFSAASPIQWRLDMLSGAEAVVGNQVSIELDNRRARERLFELVDGARSSLHLQFYILHAGAFTERLAVRLIQRARAGVAVRLIVDALYSTQDVLGMTNPVVSGLAKEPGIEIVAASPIPPGVSFEVGAFKRRNHRKLVIVDGEVALVSGRNCGDEYYTGFDEVAVTDWTRHERIPWLDAHVELRGPLVAEVQRAFVETWRRGAGETLATSAAGEGGEGGDGGEGADDPLFPPPSISGSTKARLILHEGLVDTNTLGVYEAMIDGAERHLYILNDFPILGSLIDALRRALARGVRVTLLTGSAVTRRGDGEMLPGPLPRVLFEYMTKHRLEPLIRAGAEAYEYTTPALPEIVAVGGVIRPYVHAKVMSVDGVLVSVGSANLDVTASYWEDEANVLIEDAAVAGELERALEGLIAGSYRLELDSDYWRREARQREVVSKLWPETLYS